MILVTEATGTAGHEAVNLGNRERSGTPQPVHRRVAAVGAYWMTTREFRRGRGHAENRLPSTRRPDHA